MEPILEYGTEQPKINYTTGVPYYNVDFIGGFDLILKRPNYKSGIYDRFSKIQ